MNIKSGTVLYPAGKVFEGKWGKRQSLKVRLADGSEESIWFKEGREPHASLKKGDLVQVLFEDNKRRLIVQDQGNPAPATTTPTPVRESKGYEPLDKEAKQQIAAYVEEMAKLFDFCLKQTEQQIGSNEEDRRAIATTLFIAAQRKFSL